MKFSQKTEGAAMKMAGGRYKRDRSTLSVQISTCDIMANRLKAGVYLLFYSVSWFCLMGVNYYQYSSSNIHVAACSGILTFPGLQQSKKS
jgi:hypothetical protein